MDTDTCVQGVCELTAFLTLLTEWGEADDDNERFSDTKFTAEEEELEHYAGLAQK